MGSLCRMDPASRQTKNASNAKKIVIDRISGSVIFWREGGRGTPEDPAGLARTLLADLDSEFALEQIRDVLAKLHGTALAHQRPCHVG